MFRFRPCAALVALTAIAALAVPASAFATNVTEWEIDQTNGTPDSSLAAPYANVPTQLVNWSREIVDPSVSYNPLPSALVYGHQTFGVDLTWATAQWESSSLPSYQWEFIRQPGSYVTQQVAASEHVALYNTANQKYLAWACHGTDTGCIGIPSENYGISLYWSTTPSYEWQVARGSVDPGNSWANADLYNDIEGAYLIYHPQTGVGLGWIHAAFETGPNYIPPAPPVTTSQQGNVAPPTTIKG